MIPGLQKRTLLIFVGIIASGSHATVFGQGNTFNPYGNSGYADYREFTTPLYSNDPSLPNQARLEGGFYGGRNRANQFESFNEALDGSGADQLNSNRGVANGIPYYKAYRLYDKTNRRTYKANDTPADRAFLDRLNKRDEDYQKALEEKDPTKRARLLQQIDRNALGEPARYAGNQPASKTAKASSSRVTDLPPPRRIAPTKPAAKAAKPAAAATTGATQPPTARTDADAAVDPSRVPTPAPR